MHVRVHLQAIVAVSARRAEGVSVDHAYAHCGKCKAKSRYRQSADQPSNIAGAAACA
jgi:hypothetical protein